MNSEVEKAFELFISEPTHARSNGLKLGRIRSHSRDNDEEFTELQKSMILSLAKMPYKETNATHKMILENVRA